MVVPPARCAFPTVDGPEQRKQAPKSWVATASNETMIHCPASEGSTGNRDMKTRRGRSAVAPSCASLADYHRAMAEPGASPTSSSSTTTRAGAEQFEIGTGAAGRNLRLPCYRHRARRQYSVPGLAAKPIIDIAVELYDVESLAGRLPDLEELGYIWDGDTFLPGRHDLHKPPRRGPSMAVPTHSTCTSLATPISSMSSRSVTISATTRSGPRIRRLETRDRCQRVDRHGLHRRQDRFHRTLSASCVPGPRRVEVVDLVTAGSAPRRIQFTIGATGPKPRRR